MKPRDDRRTVPILRAQHPMIGRELGNYVIRGLLGEGGMGAVFAGEHRFLGDRVAIKVLHGTFANNPAITERFFQEAKSARDIGHPSIIKILDFGQSADGGLYLVMELLDGRSLAAALAGGPLDEAAAVRLGAAIADGLAAAHAKGIVHRDLKPDNIFIAGDDVKILDFGIAKVTAGTGRTGTGAILGTPRYMAPEQARGARSVGPHSDVWALGVILYQLLTGTTPFDADDPMGILIKVLSETPARPSTLAKVSPRMDALVMRCLEKDPARRVATMTELYQALSQMTGPGGLSVGTATPAISPSLRAPGASTTLSGSAGQVAGRSVPRRRRVVITIAGIAAFALGLIGTSIWSFSSKPATESAVETPPPAPEPEKDEAKPVADNDEQEHKKTTAEAPNPPATETVVVHSNPEGATAYIDGSAHGVTPVMLVDTLLPRNIELRLKGYNTMKGTLSRETVKNGEATFTLVHAPKTPVANPPPAPKNAAAPKTTAPVAPAPPSPAAPKPLVPKPSLEESLD